MGNIGRSSTGCYLCRKRKIKCDEGKPGCRKCALIRKDCPGYPFSVELKIRPDQEVKTPNSSVTSSSAAKSDQGVSPASTCGDTVVKLPLGKHAKTVLISSSCDDCMPKCECLEPERKLDVIPKHRSPTPPPKYDVQHQSLCFFLNLFCYQASRLYGAAILDYLPEMLSKTGSEACIQQATTAVSRLTLADRYSGRDVRLQTAREYGQALARTNITIRDKSNAIKDETVVSVWLLGLYENLSAVLSHGRVNKEARSPVEEYESHLSHIRGAMHLLRLRGQSQLSAGRGEKIYRIFKAAIQMRLFMLNSVTSDEFENLEQDVFRDEHEFLPSETANRATSYFHSVARLLEQVKYAIRRQSDASDPCTNVPEVIDILRQGEVLDAGMSNWSRDEPGWDMMKVVQPTAGTMWAFYPSHAIYFFCSFWVFLYWLRYLIARVKLYEGLITAAQRQKTVLACRSCGREPATSQVARIDFKISQYRTIFQLAAGEIIGLTAYALGDVSNQGGFLSSASVGSSQSAKGFQEINVVAAMQLVIPLKLLQRSNNSTPTQKGAVDLALGQIGDGFRRQPLNL